MVTGVYGGETVFFNVMTIKYVGKIENILKHSHGRCVVDALDKNLHQGYIWIGYKSVISFIFRKSIFPHFVHHGTSFYDKYITSDDKKKYMDDDGSGIFPKQKVVKIYNAKYQNIYYNLYYVLKMTI